VGVLAAFSLLAVGGLARAQQPAGGALEGHVRGPGGAAVPGATVLVENEQTGARKMTWTDLGGDYQFRSLPPGNYKLEVSLVGFRPDVRTPVPIASGKTLQVGIALVMAAPPAGEAMAARQGAGALPQAASRSSLPAELRQRLQTGAGEQTGGAGEFGAAEGSVRFSASGPAESAPAGEPAGGGVEPASNDLQASAENSFLLSGSVAQAATPEGNAARRMERMERFRQMRESQQAPGFGGGGGRGEGFIFFAGRMGRRAQVNRLRGNFFENYSNSALNARPYPLNAPPSPQIPTWREQAGFALGGPLVIPHIYNGRDKTSFFVHYSLDRGRSPFDRYSTVPTALERAGDFSQTVIASGPLAGTTPAIYNPQPNSCSPGTTFPGNQIPACLLDPAAVGLLQYIPLPNLPGQVQNFHLREALPSSSDRVMARIGQQLSARDSLNAFYFLNSAHSQSVSNFPAFTTNVSTRSQNLNLSESHTFSPRVVNTLLVNFNRQRTSTLNPFAYTNNVAGDLGIQGISTDPRDWGVPQIGFTNFTALNDAIPSLSRNQTLRAVDILMVNSGRHNLRLGGEVRRVWRNTLQDPDARGTFNFTGFTTSEFTAQGYPVAGTGYDFADFLLGLPQVTSARFGTSSNYFRSWVYSGFAQDDWRASSHLTLNLGLRYEFFQPLSEKYGHLSDLEIGPDYSTVSVVTGQNPQGLPASLVRGDANNWSPRVGLAYRPWSRHTLVVRAGYGIFYDDSIYLRLVPNLANQPPFAQASTLTTSAQRVLTLEQGFPTVSPSVIRNTYAVDPNFRTPYGQTWNFTLDDEIARDLILSVGYVGTKGSKLDLLLGPNLATSGNPLNTQENLTLSNAQQFTYETSGASSIYQGLQVGLRRQFHSGFALNATYTFAKSIDDAASVGGAGRSVAQNYLDLAAERGLSSFDVRHRLLVNEIYELPFGERKRFLNRGGPLAAVLGDWQLSGFATLQSGTPFTAQVRGNQSNNNGTGAYFSERADSTGLPASLPAGQRTTLDYFNTAAFTLPAPGQFGNAGRNTIPGPSRVTFNMALGRFVTLSRERNIRANFRIQAQNLFNTPNFSGLATVVNASNFGRITGVGSMRSLTISARVMF
jgi:Carboxypeptidase regulatory-like domain